MKRDESTRRNFLRMATAGALTTTLSNASGEAALPGAEAEEKRGNAIPRPLIWAYLVQLNNRRELSDREASPCHGFDMSLWDELLARMVKAGANTVLIDLGIGVKYESHPEIAGSDAWSVQQLREELGKLRKMGLEPIPELNFSTSGDAWLGPYSRCVSTDRYYQVCQDLISEVIEIFDKPRLFHLGMDEEDIETQQGRHYQYVMVRQYDLFWHDWYFLFENVEKRGVRPWVWADMIRRMDPEVYLKKMPKSVLQSNWYYEKTFTEGIVPVKNYLDLEEHGYDQVPTGSNFVYPQNFRDTVAFARQHIAPERLLGFLQTSWMPTLPEHRDWHLAAIDEIGQAMGQTRST